VHTIESERERRIFAMEVTEGEKGNFYHEEHEGRRGKRQLTLVK